MDDGKDAASSKEDALQVDAKPMLEVDKHPPPKKRGARLHRHSQNPEYLHVGPPILQSQGIPNTPAN